MKKLMNCYFIPKTYFGKYPKAERFDLCTDIKERCYKMLRLVMYAWRTKNRDKQLEYLTDCDVELAVLKTLIRISYKMKYITDKNYMAWSNKISEIGKMLRRMDKSMPRRINNIFYQKVKFKKMYEAYERASKGKHQNKEVILFEMNLGENLLSILNDIYYGKYKIGIYRKFLVYEPKERMILALPFRDRVMQQWYVEEFIKPIFLPKMITQNYACIKNRGSHLAVKTLKKYMNLKYKKNPNFYILKVDVSKFFNSIDKNILYSLIEKRVKDKAFLNCTKGLIFDGTTKGIPIGNYTSQFFANIYLTELDHFVKESLRIKYYVRYMDDFILLIDSKEEAIQVLEKIRRFLNEKLKLNINKKTNYFKAKQGVTFLGYHVYIDKIRLLNSNKKRIYKKVKTWNKLYNENNLDLLKAAESLKAWMGHASLGDNYKYIKKIKQKCKWYYNE